MKPQTLIWLIIIAVGGIDCVLLISQGLWVADKWPPLLSVLFLFSISMIYRHRSLAISCLSMAGAQMVAFSHVGAVLTYAALAASPFPMADTLLSQADAALGFDWLKWFAFVNAYPALHFVFAMAYSSIPVQTLGLVLYFSFQDTRRVHELVLAAVLAIVITTPLMVLLPAVGDASHNGVGIVWSWTHDILALRSHTLLIIGNTDGIVFFPSFHTVLGVLFVATMRGHKWFWPLFVVNGLLIASVPSEGSHYGVDILGGLAVAFASFRAARLLLTACSSEIETIEPELSWSDLGRSGLRLLRSEQKTGARALADL